MDLAGAQRLAGLNQFTAGRQHHDAGTGADPDRAAADGGEQADLGGAEDGARRQGQLAFGDIAAAGPDMGAGGGRAVDADLAAGVLGGGAVGAHRGGRPLARAAVGPFDRDDGLGAGRYRGAGHDAGGLTGPDRGQFAAARRDIADDGEGGRGALRGVRDIGGPDRVAVHRAVVEGRQGDGDRDVLDQYAALGVEELQLDRVERSDLRQHVVEMLGHRPDAVLVAGPAGGVVQRLTSPR
ncbi:hypothetical protein Srufu_046200 [Streptomyces libani subsp. rufus]|nr:hypothetical protein Srufu_046200 [Streptomyces libani subsp. rufus]